MRATVPCFVFLGVAYVQAIALPVPGLKGGWHGFCGIPGASCGLKAREPQGGSIGYCGVPGESCLKKKREAEILTDYGRHGFCGIPGESCAMKSRATQGETGFCGVPGESCGGLKRSAEVVRDAFAGYWAKPLAKKSGASTLCNAPGQTCDVATRTIEEITELAEDLYNELLGFNDMVRLRGGGHGFCGVPGESCRKVKRNSQGWTGFCGVPGESCLRKEKRDADVVIAAKTLTEANPSFLKEECAKEGNECSILVNARDAFRQVQREVEALRLSDLEAKQNYCDMQGCDDEVLTYLKRALSGHAEAKRAEEDCYRREGACEFAERSLDRLERSLDAAVEAALG